MGVDVIGEGSEVKRTRKKRGPSRLRPDQVALVSRQACQISQLMGWERSVKRVVMLEKGDKDDEADRQHSHGRGKIVLSHHPTFPAVMEGQGPCISDSGLIDKMGAKSLQKSKDFGGN
jgi:hypothetical protein